MKTNGWVASSQHLYRRLLQLYPQGYRENYEEEMFHLFTDQCREANGQRGKFGILALWLRTLGDVGVSVVREHLSDPNAGVGLLEAVPNAPLPWKGVLLVLIPGLIFFASQIEQVTSNNDWFFLAFYRAGYFLILPVLLIWLLTRRFPVWGLIPLGLLYATVENYTQRLSLNNVLLIGYGSGFDLFGIRLTPYSLKNLLVALICVTLLGILIWYSTRHGQISRSAWKWLGLYGSLILLQLAGDIRSYIISINNHNYSSPVDLQVILPDLKGELFRLLALDLSQSLPFLLLIFIGLFFARRHQGLTFLLLLGYLLPTIIFGRYGIWNKPIDFYLVSLAVLIYRFVVALVAPTWLVRAASIKGRQRAAAIPVAIAIACQAILNLTVSIAWANQFVYGTDLFTAVTLIWNVWGPLTIAIGLGLAVALYLPREMKQTVISPPSFVPTAE